MASSAVPRADEVIGVSRKIEDLEHVEASTSAATVLPGVPLPEWTHLGEPEPTPEPAPAPALASVMELVSVGAAVEQQGQAVRQRAEPAAGGPGAAELGAAAMTTTAPDVPMPSVPSTPSMAPAAPAPSFAPPAEMAGSEVSMLAGAMPAPESFAPPVAVASIPAPPLSSPDLAAPITLAPLLFSPPAPLVTSPVAGTDTTADAFADAVPVQSLGDIGTEAAPMGDPTTDAADDAASDDNLDAAATPSRRPLVLLLVVGIVAILGAVAAFVYPALLVSHDDPAPVAPVTQQQPQAVPRIATLAVPATVAGLDTITGAPAAALSAAASSTALTGFSTPVSAVYGKAGVPGATVIAWNAAPSSPAANIASAFAGFETASVSGITDIAEVPITGGLTGLMSCGSGIVNAAPATVCFWADDTTFGAVTILKPITAKDGALTAVAVRQAVEKVA